MIVPVGTSPRGVPPTVVSTTVGAGMLEVTSVAVVLLVVGGASATEVGGVGDTTVIGPPMTVPNADAIVELVELAASVTVGADPEGSVPPVAPHATVSSAMADAPRIRAR